MRTEQLLSLVEYVAYKVGCVYISDLPELDILGKMRAADAIESIPVDAYPLKQWNDALKYIAHGNDEPSPGEARAALLRKLRDKECR